VRDTRLDEDASRILRNPGIFALLRSFALNLLRFNQVDNISLVHPGGNILDNWGARVLPISGCFFEL
jgi:hypothetical protein